MRERGAQLDAEYHAISLRLAEELLMPAVKRGELWAIQNILKLAAEAIQDQSPLSKGVAAYISKALASIHDGEKADEAFGIRRKRGEKDTRKVRQRKYFMADCIERLRHHDGLTLEDAVEIVAGRFSMSNDSAKLAWKVHHKEVKRIHQLEIKTFGQIQEVVWPR